MLDLLRKSLLVAPVIKRGEYHYFIHPLTDAIPPIQPDLLMEVCQYMAENTNLDADLILTMEAMGIHLGAVLSEITGIPLGIVRKRRYGLPGEVVLDQETGYSKGALYLNSVKPGDRIYVVDAVISTGGTLSVVLNALKTIGAEVVDVVCVIGRGDGVATVREATGFNVKTLVKIDVDGTGVKIL